MGQLDGLWSSQMAGKFEVKAFSGRVTVLYSGIRGGKKPTKPQLLHRISCVRESVLTNLI